MRSGEQSVKQIPQRRAALRGKTPGVKLTPGEIELFLEDMRAKGRVEGTIDWYRRGLLNLYETLPEGQRIREGTLSAWWEQLLEDGYAPRTVNLFISAANSLLEYKGFREYQLTEQLKPEDKLQPELTRVEYLHLLQTAKLLGKLFGSTGLPLQELPKITVEAVEEGKATIAPNGIKQLCAAAKIPEEKGNPRCLRKLYLSTRAGIEANIALLVEQAHDRMMEQEQLSVGWEN